MQHIRIAIIVDTLRCGGKERRLVELIKGLIRNHHVTIELVVLSKIIHYKEILDLDVKIHFLVRRWEKDPRIFIQLFKIWKNFNPDIIQCWESMSAIYATPIAKLLKVKFVNAMIYDAPNPFSWGSSKWTRSKLTFPFSHAIVANSQAGLDTYKAPSSKSHLIYNGFDFDRLNNLTDKDAIRSKFNITTSKVIGMVATFSHLKDHKTFITAAQSILEHRDDVTFICIGGAKGNSIEESKSMIKTKNKDRIILAGALDGIESLVNIFTIGVLATYSEGISNAIIEYMALAKPVIATDGGGTRELVLHEQTGILVSQKNAAELEEKIIYLLDNPDVAINMGNEGRQRIKDHFSLDRMSSQFYEIYQRLIL